MKISQKLFTKQLGTIPNKSLKEDRVSNNLCVVSQLGTAHYFTDPRKHSANVMDYVLLKTFISPHKSLPYYK
jgi:hypothetical protein